MTALWWRFDKSSKFSPWLRRCTRCIGAASVHSHFRKPQKNSGQATVEYVLVLAMIGVVSLGITTAMNRMLQDGITRFTAVLEKDLSPGSYPEKFDQWRMAE